MQNWLAADPKRLGLGQVTILAQELSPAPGRRLDILAADRDIYYSVEVQLGEVDAPHGFRVFDYWANNRTRYPDKTHVAVLVAESADGRYRQALEALAEYLPLVVIALRAWRGGEQVAIVPEPLIVNDSLEISGTVGITSGAARTEQDWQQQLSDEARAFNEAFIAWTRQHLGEVRISYSAISYIGVWRGRRVWAPLWPRQDGATINLPDPDGTKGEEPSVAVERFRERLRDARLDISWQPAYNAGANPVCIRLRLPDLDNPVVQELLRASFEILAQGTAPWSERHPPTPPGDVRPADDTSE